MENSEKLGLFVIVNAKPEKANDVKQFLLGGLALANKEAETRSWYAFQINETTFGIFDTFENEDGRDAHLNGEIAKALLQNADDLLVDFQVSDINKLDLLAVK
ncbi:MAG: antibiotic biosynthesis monooxygenase [Flavobacteriaceae bacterium]